MEGRRKAGLVALEVVRKVELVAFELVVRADTKIKLYIWHSAS